MPLKTAVSVLINLVMWRFPVRPANISQKTNTVNWICLTRSQLTTTLCSITLRGPERVVRLCCRTEKSVRTCRIWRFSFFKGSSLLWYSFPVLDFNIRIYIYQPDFYSILSNTTTDRGETIYFFRLLFFCFSSSVSRITFHFFVALITGR